MAKFSNAKVGDKVWSSVRGYGKIIAVHNENNFEYPLDVVFDDGITRTYTFDGKYKTDYNYPTLFWNEFHIPIDEEDKKPFNLVEFLKENLEPTKFEKPTGYTNWTDNIYLAYMYSECEWKYVYDRNFEIPTVYFKSICKEVLEKLTMENVTPQQLKQAYKKLNWI